MSVCEACWAAEAEYECSLCRRRVCRAHYIEERRICSICYENMCAVCGGKLAVDSCIICGRLICRSCSVELQPGIRMCEDCYKRAHEYIREDPRLSYIKRYLKTQPQP